MKKIFSIVLAIIMSVGIANAQRTSAGYNFISASFPVSFTGDGLAGISYGRYQLRGYWDTEVKFVNRNAASRIGDCEYSDITAGWNYMYRLVSTRNRAFSIYTGAGMFLGAEVLDVFGKFDSSKGIITGCSNHFLYGVAASAEAEVYLSKKFAMALRYSVPINFSSTINMVNYELGIGLRITF